MPNSVPGFVGAALAGGILVATPHMATAYSPDIHERSVREGAAICKLTHGVKLGKTVLNDMIDGVREPDKLSLSLLQMFKQRIEPGSYGKQRSVMMTRIAAQSFHGSPNPTRPVYSNSAKDQALKRKTIPIPRAQLLPNRLDMEAYSYDTNQGVRNKMLINASQFLCVSFAHKSASQSARKFGNMLHMIGDTYSASHVQRSAPVGSPDNCGTEKIEWHFSMDLIAWKLHTPADAEYKDWRFRCLVKHTSDLIKLWADGRKAVNLAAGKSAKRKKANVHVGKIMRQLCSRVLREDAAVLRKPSGGAAAGYSIASGTDNWEILKSVWKNGKNGKLENLKGLWKRDREDKPIQTIGLTSPEEAEAFYRAVNERLRKKGGPEHFWYPPRSMKDLCRGLGAAGPLAVPLQCTPQEISWAMDGSDRVQTMWIPKRPAP